jgi:hypothetical protein
MNDWKRYEQALKKRWRYPYRWGRVQNDRFDTRTRFVYDVSDFDRVLEIIQRQFSKSSQYEAYFNYALNRWYNFWSARAVEEIFCAMDGVEPAKNHRDRLVDFSIKGIRFDHKTSVFPKGFSRDLNFAVNHPNQLIQWLYQHQSQQQRKHYANRLFIVLYAADGEHWKLKAELSWLKTCIQAYVAAFDPRRLWRFSLIPGEQTLSDIIWAIRV